MSPFDKTIPEPAFGPLALFCFLLVSSSFSSSSSLVLFLVSFAVFPPNAPELLFLSNDNLLVVLPFISSPSLFCFDLGKISFSYYLIVFCWFLFFFILTVQLDAIPVQALFLPNILVLPSSLGLPSLPIVPVSLPIISCCTIEVSKPLDWPSLYLHCPCHVKTL